MIVLSSGISSAAMYSPNYGYVRALLRACSSVA
jgi:hypothetical protein